MPPARLGAARGGASAAAERAPAPAPAPAPAAPARTSAGGGLFIFSAAIFLAALLCYAAAGGAGVGVPPAAAAPPPPLAAPPPAAPQLAAPPPPPAAPPPPPPRAWSRLVVATLTLSPDAIGYAGTPPHTPGPFCATRPNGAPLFGEQCTMAARGALRACLSLRGCSALTQPDPAPYMGRREDLGTDGPVAQARAVTAAAWAAGAALEAAHGMCAPGGCASAFLTIVGAADAAPGVARALDAALARAGAPPLPPAADLLAVAAGTPRAELDRWGLGAAPLLAAALPVRAPPGAPGAPPGLLVDAATPARAALAESLGAGAGAPAWARPAAALDVYVLAA
jgi:hypothetical protein